MFCQYFVQRVSSWNEKFGVKAKLSFVYPFEIVKLLSILVY